MQCLRRAHAWLVGRRPQSQEAIVAGVEATRERVEGDMFQWWGWGQILEGMLACRHLL